MRLDLRQSARMVVALVLVTLFLVPTDLRAQNHVVSPAELMTTIAATVTRKMRNATRRLRSRKSPIAERASGRAERPAPRPPRRRSAWPRLRQRFRAT